MTGMPERKGIDYTAVLVFKQMIGVCVSKAIHLDQ